MISLEGLRALIPYKWASQVVPADAGERPWVRKEMATHSSILAWRIPWTEEAVACSPWSRKESDTTE